VWQAPGRPRKRVLAPSHVDTAPAVRPIRRSHRRIHPIARARERDRYGSSEDDGPSNRRTDMMNNRGYSERNADQSPLTNLCRVRPWKTLKPASLPSERAAHGTNAGPAVRVCRAYAAIQCASPVHGSYLLFLCLRRPCTSGDRFGVSLHTAGPARRACLLDDD
jgi:hypothetical protein